MRWFLSLLLFGILAHPALALERFPPPEFDPSYHKPETTMPPPRANWQEVTDTLVLAGALVLASFLALKQRSRPGLLALSVFSLAYFGLYRKGCVCVIGSVQNVALALFDSSYAIPATVILFFVLPLAFTLFFGRVFCSSVCPHGALQDLVLLRPVKVPAWLEEALGLLAYVYLGAAVLLAATGSAFLICEYDPFVALFRLSGEAGMLALGLCFLLIGLFVGRPYCRYLCPYGALLRQFSMLAKWHVAITPTTCTNCRLCEEACPYGAIRTPNVALVQRRSAGKTRLAALLVLLPLLIAGAGWVTSLSSGALARMHSVVRLDERIALEDSHQVTDTTNASNAFRGTGRTVEELHADAQTIRHRFKAGGWLLGAWIGLVLGVKLIQLSVRRRRGEHTIDRATCVACARCFEYCPMDAACAGGSLRPISSGVTGH